MSTFDPSPRLPTTKNERVLLWIGATVLTALFGAEVFSNFNNQRLSVLFVLLFWGPMLILHEAGHALAARAVGWKVSEVVIGFGREVTRFSFGETLIRIKTLPIEGYVIPDPVNVAGARVKSAVIYAAGPGAEIAFIGISRLLLGPQLFEASDEIGIIVWQSAALAAAIGAAFNLVPYPTQDGMSDGLGIVLSLLTDSKSFSSRLAAPARRQIRHLVYAERYEQAEKLCADSLKIRPEDAELIGLSAVCQAARGEAQLALDTLEALGHPDDQPGVTRHELLLCAGWVVLLGKDRTLLHQAHNACQRALEGDPTSTHAHLLMGQVQLARGQGDAAFEHLMRGYSASKDRDEEGQLTGYLMLAAAETKRDEILNRFLPRWQETTMGPALRAKLMAAIATHTATTSPE